MSRVPSLVELCQRVATANVDYITDLGDSLSYELVKPILERCNVEQLTRLEQASPHLQRSTPEIWKQLCFKTYPAAIERYNRGLISEPDSWREQYYNLVAEEERRLEQVANKMRRQRQKAEERRKGQEIKITNIAPPAKRKWGITAPAKTLFQKAKTETSRLQKNIYSTPILPPMPPNGKSYRVLPSNNSALLPPASTSAAGAKRVTVTTVVHKVVAASSTSRPPAFGKVVLPTSSPPRPAEEPPLKKPRLDAPPPPPSASLRKPSAAKRDPAASLFMPKHRAYSQRVS
ncbi:hypothetical protein MKEN_01051200 [Mycena kentingensis (nom. inval.)]|nr:hypothetical protein MKEN_01051200 [Mycena kentingensis (nom. inval.)]